MCSVCRKYAKGQLALNFILWLDIQMEQLLRAVDPNFNLHQIMKIHDLHIIPYSQTTIKYHNVDSECWQIEVQVRLRRAVPSFSLLGIWEWKLHFVIFCL